MLHRVKTHKYTLAGKLILLLAGLYGFIPASSYASVECKVTNAGDIWTYPVLIYSTDKPGISKDMYVRGPRIKCTVTPPQEKMGKLMFKIEPSGSYNATYPDVFNTNLAGVGIKHVVAKSPNCKLSSPTLITCDIKLKEHEIHFLIRKLFYKTAAIQEFGTINIPQGHIKYYLEEDGPDTAKDLPGLLEAKSVLVSKNGCTLNTPDLNFNLGKHQQNTFKGMGSTGQEITQPIILSCNPKTKYSLTVNGDDAGKPGVITLAQEPGAAKGIGVQLLTEKDNQPIILGSAKEMGTTASSGTNLQETIDITARYYQTENTITPGSANASATFTMTYE
ncbi:putative fimbrial subunit [Yersinia aldovae]|nr:putative fimbrial subunit [Yersinia aldovae]